MNSCIMMFIVSVLPIILIGFFVYKHDRNKEPFGLLIKLFYGGIASCLLVLLVTYFLGLIFPVFSASSDDLEGIWLFINVFIGIALVEELCKWVVVYIGAYYSQSFDEFYDMIIYCVFVALGFACFENLLYVYENGIGIGISRAILAVPSHACCGVFMGYYLGLAKVNELKKRFDFEKIYIGMSILIPMVCHGIYDYCLISGIRLLIYLFFIFVVIMDIYAIKKIKKISSINQRIRYKDRFCPRCGHIMNSNYCPRCGSKNQ